LLVKDGPCYCFYCVHEQKGYKITQKED